MKKNQDGYVLAYVLIVITILLALSAAVVTFSYQNLKKQVNAVNSSELTYEAEGSIEQFVSLLSAEEFVPEASTTTDSEGNTVTVTDDEGNIDYATTAPELLISWATEEISIDGLFVSDSEIEVITIKESSESDSGTTAVFLSYSTGGMLYDLEGNSLGEVTAYTAPSETTEEDDSTTTTSGSATVATASDDGTTTTTTYKVSAGGVWTKSETGTESGAGTENLDGTDGSTSTTVTIVISTSGNDTSYTCTYLDNTLSYNESEVGTFIHNADGTVTVDATIDSTTIDGTYEVTDNGNGTETWEVSNGTDGTVSVTLYLLACAADEDSGTAEVSAELNITLTESTTTDDDGTETIIYTADYSYVSYET